VISISNAYRIGDAERKDALSVLMHLFMHPLHESPRTFNRRNVWLNLLVSRGYLERMLHGSQYNTYRLTNEWLGTFVAKTERALYDAWSSMMEELQSYEESPDAL
jgi:hypothetical protein